MFKTHLSEKLSNTIVGIIGLVSCIGVLYFTAVFPTYVGYIIQLKIWHHTGSICSTDRTRAIDDPVIGWLVGVVSLTSPVWMYMLFGKLIPWIGAIVNEEIKSMRQDKFKKLLK